MTRWDTGGPMKRTAVDRQLPLVTRNSKLFRAEDLAPLSGKGKRRRLSLNYGFVYRKQIDGCAGGLSVLAYLARCYRHSSEGQWRERLQQGEIALGGQSACVDTVLEPGQWLVWRRPPWEEPEVPRDFTVLYEDEQLLAVGKPCGLPTLPGGGFLENTLLALVRERTPEATPMHRLGRGTSGLVLFALTAQARSTLAESFRRKAVTKVYRALASGIPSRADFVIEAPIGPVPHPRLGTIHAASSTGKRALSRVSILERRTNSSLLQVTIETGKPHQIRIHLATAGHPLVGDPLYAVGGGLKADGPALPGDIGYWLHAERLTLPHPVTGAPCTIYCDPPPQLLIGGETRW